MRQIFKSYGLLKILKSIIFKKHCMTNYLNNWYSIQRSLQWLAAIKKYLLISDLVEFLGNHDNVLRDSLIDSKNDIVYLTDRFYKFNL